MFCLLLAALILAAAIATRTTTSVAMRPCHAAVQWRMYVWEAIFFLAIDSSLGNIPYSAFITYVVSRVLTWLLATATRNNISQKTMVDKHFLI